MMYQDALYKAIRDKIAPDVVTAMKNADSMELLYPQDSVSVPLRADVAIGWDKNLCGFNVRARTKDDEKGWFLCEQFFSSEKLENPVDRYNAIDFLFNLVKREFAHALANGELDRLMEGKANG